MKIFKFNSEPEFAELWDLCINNFLYNKDAYIKDILSLFKSINISKKSEILDTCAGTGFISLYLRQKGFDVDCMDLMRDEIRVFQKRARKLGVSDSIKQLSWKEIPNIYSPDSYDFLFCRGNSFIYADGGWNQNQVVNQDSSLKSYEETLRIFYKTLKQGGCLYIDKFPDNEKDSHKVVARIKVAGNIEDLIIYTKRNPSGGYREARMIRRASSGIETGLQNKAYDLKESELELLLKKAGFRNIKRIKLDSEKYFTVWLAQK